MKTVNWNYQQKNILHNGASRSTDLLIAANASDKKLTLENPLETNTIYNEKK